MWNRAPNAPALRLAGGSARRSRQVKQALLSLLILAFLVLKIAEGGLGIEEWPLTNVSMFYERRPKEIVPKRAHFFGVRNGATFEMTASDFRLPEDEFNTIIRDAPDLALACGNLARLYNQRRLHLRRKDQLLDSAYAEREEIPRPQVARPPWQVREACPLETPPPAGAAS